MPIKRVTKGRVSVKTPEEKKIPSKKADIKTKKLTNKKPKAGGYSAENITVLEGLEAVKKRPGMYIGSTGATGLHHMIWEVVDNAFDEAMAGYCDTVIIKLLPDHWVSVYDNGRGIPVDIHPKKKSVLWN